MAEIADVLDAIKTSVNNVQASLADAQDRLSAVKKEHANWTERLAKLKQEHAGKISEIEAKTVEANRAAEENGRRIKLNNDQVAEITRIRAILDKRTKDLDHREAALNGARDEAQRLVNKLDQREAEVRRKEEEIGRRYAKMKEAMA